VLPLLDKKFLRGRREEGLSGRRQKRKVNKHLDEWIQRGHNFLRINQHGGRGNGSQTAIVMKLQVLEENDVSANFIQKCSLREGRK
jgi:hypothetical protein